MWWKRLWPRLWKVKHDPQMEIAEAALDRATRDEELVRSRWPLISSLSEELEAMRSENNFAARIRAAYGEGR